MRIFTHFIALLLGFLMGIYILPILTAPKSIDLSTLQESMKNSEYQANFEKNLKGSDFAHWGEGTISISNDRITHIGKISPGPDYKLYLLPTYADDEASFNKIKADSLFISDIKNFDGFIVTIPPSVDVTNYNSILIWCEAFGQFITSAQYRYTEKVK